MLGFDFNLSHKDSDSHISINRNNDGVVSIDFKDGKFTGISGNSTIDPRRMKMASNLEKHKQELTMLSEPATQLLEDYINEKIDVVKPEHLTKLSDNDKIDLINILKKIN